MRILLLNFEYPPLGGGASPVSKTIADSLAAKGHEISVVTMGFYGLSKTEKEGSITIHRIESKRQKANMSYPMEHLRFLRNAMRFLRPHLSRNSYDVVHCHFILSTGILARWVKKRFGIPYIITSHGSDLPGFNPDRFQLIHRITPLFIKRILNDCNYVISPSKYLSGLIIPFLSDHDKLKIIPNGIGSDFPIKIKKNIILSTGRLLERKGFHTLLRVGAKLNLDFEIHICGDGPMMNELKSIAKNSKTKIIFHGWMNNTSEDYLRLLAEAKIYVLVSRFENASIALLEAMRNSCAVITSDTSGCPETVGNAGICIPPDDQEALESALLQLTNTPQKIKELGEKANLRAQSVFSWQKITEQYETILKKSRVHD